jgi:Zn-dependent protease
MQGSFEMGRIAGIRIRIHPTWFIIFVLITTSLVFEFAGQFPDRRPLLHAVAGIVTSFLFFGSVLFHEMSHSLLAQRLGYPVRSITLFVFGGVSEIQEEAHNPSSEFWIAVIGPFSSFFLAVFFFALAHLTLNASPEASAVFDRLSGINLALGVFNMLPAFPLDGGRVLRSILWKAWGSLQRATASAARVGKSLGYVMIMVGILIAFASGSLLNGLWIAFVGWFLMNAAEASAQNAVVHNVLEGATARDIMTSECLIIPGGLTVEELVHDHVLPTGQRCFLVVDGNVLTGMISLSDIKRLPREDWPRTRVEQAMNGIEMLATVTPETKIEEVLRLMDDKKVNQVPVLEQQRVAGIITREHLLNLIRTRFDLAR